MFHHKGYSLFYIFFFWVVPSIWSTPTSFRSNVGQETTNVPIRLCENSERGEYADLTTIFLDPPCEQADNGYCGLRRNQNYTFIAKFLSKYSTKSLSVRVSTADPRYGWETLLWPEFSVCSRFNITCPQDNDSLVEAYLDRQVPKGVPPTRALVRVRLMGMNEDYAKKIMICREFNVQLF